MVPSRRTRRRRVVTTSCLGTPTTPVGRPRPRPGAPTTPAGSILSSFSAQSTCEGLITRPWCCRRRSRSYHAFPPRCEESVDRHIPRPSRARQSARTTGRSRTGLPRAELASRPDAPDLDRVERIDEFWSYPQSRAFAELLIDCEEDRTLRAVRRDAARDGATALVVHLNRSGVVSWRSRTCAARTCHQRRRGGRRRRASSPRNSSDLPCATENPCPLSGTPPWFSAPPIPASVVGPRFGEWYRVGTSHCEGEPALIMSTRT